MTDFVGSQDRLVLVFGDQTDSISDTLQLLYSQAPASPWLQLFLGRATSLLRDELSASAFQQHLDADFTDLLQCAEKFSATDSGLTTVLVTTVRAGVLIQYAASNPEMFSSQVPICLAAVCGGLLNAVTFPTAHNMSSLCQAGLDSIRLAVRLVQIIGARTRAVYDGPGRWGWYVSGIDAAQLQSILDVYHEAQSTAQDQTLRIAGTGLEESWHTVIGPPPVLQHFFSTNQQIKDLPKFELPIKGYVHVGPAATDTEMEQIMGGMTSVHGDLDSTVPRANVQLISLGEGGLLSAPTWRGLLSLVAREILTQPLNLTRGLCDVKSTVEDAGQLRVLCAGPSTHIQTVAAYLEFECDKELSVEYEPQIPPLDDPEVVSIEIPEVKPIAGRSTSGISVTAAPGDDGKRPTTSSDTRAQITQMPSPAPSTTSSKTTLSNSEVATAASVAKPSGKSKVVLLQGRKASGQTPLFMFPDGTGSALTYMYLGRLSDSRPLYALESPLLNQSYNPIGGVEEISTLFKESIIETQPSGKFLLAGYSLGAVYAYETARQLINDGYEVEGLMIFDMAVPLPRTDLGLPPSAINLLRPPTMLKPPREGEAHMAAMIRMVAEYNPEPMAPGSRPRRVWLAWCRRGVAERLTQEVRKELNQTGLTTEATAGFMEDPAAGVLGWVVPPGKPLGCNGWDKLVGEVKCTSIDADHFTLIVPPGVTRFQRAIEDGLAYFTED
ncbi:hypothetical protein MCOR25_008328 [Pyricularia grisea]|nr:hypothetical protein MCOR25_008328 [Pyricularia grisea]